MGTNTVNASITFSRLSDNKPLTISLDEHNQLGKGSFGSAYRVTHSEYAEALVCKTINLKGSSKNFHLSYHHLLRMTYREVTYLQKVNLLVGYYYDKKNHRMMILMKFIPGQTEWELNKEVNPQAPYISFCALRKLHRQGIAHMDPHESNFIHDPVSHSALAIDFGLSQDNQHFRELRDIYFFFKRRNNIDSQSSAFHCGSVSHLLQFYCQEMKSYILANQWEVAQQVLIYSAVLIAAISGVSVLGAASLLAQQLITATLLQRLSEMFETMQDHYELRAWNQHYKEYYRNYYYCVCGLLVVLQGFLFTIQLSQLSNSTALFWKQYASTTSALEMTHILFQLNPLIKALHYWQNNYEKYLSSDEELSLHYEVKIQEMAHPKSFLPLFWGRNLKNPTPLPAKMPFVPSPAMSIRNN